MSKRNDHEEGVAEMIASGELCEHGEYADKCDEEDCPGGTEYKPYWLDRDNVFYYEQREDGSFRFDDELVDEEDNCW